MQNQPAIFPITLYHGTDERIIELAQEERLFLKTQSYKIADAIVSFVQKKLSITDLKDSVAYNRAIEKFVSKDLQNFGLNLYSNSFYPLFCAKRNLGDFQYEDLYLTGDYCTAQSYARGSYAGGELCGLVLEGYNGINKIWPDEFEIYADMRKAIDMMQNLSAQTRKPIVVEFPKVETRYLLLEDGRSIDDVLSLKPDSLMSMLYRYLGSVNFDDMVAYAVD